MQRRVAWCIFGFSIFNDFLDSIFHFHKLQKSISGFSSVTCESSSCWIGKLQASEASLSRIPFAVPFEWAELWANHHFSKLCNSQSLRSFSSFPAQRPHSQVACIVKCSHRRPFSSRPVVTCFQKAKKKKSIFHMLRISFSRSDFQVANTRCKYCGKSSVNLSASLLHTYVLHTAPIKFQNSIQWRSAKEVDDKHISIKKSR